MANLKVDYDELTQQAENLKTNHQLLVDGVTGLAAVRDELAGTWEGKKYDKFDDMVTDIKTVQDKFNGEIEGFIEEVKALAQAYKDLEES
jgi:WXG100 family type VII secretion target